MASGSVANNLVQSCWKVEGLTTSRVDHARQGETAARKSCKQGLKNSLHASNIVGSKSALKDNPPVAAEKHEQATCSFVRRGTVFLKNSQVVGQRRRLNSGLQARRPLQQSRGQPHRSPIQSMTSARAQLNEQAEKNSARTEAVQAGKTEDEVGEKEVPTSILSRPRGASKGPLTIPANRSSPRGFGAWLPNARPGWLLVPVDVVTQKLRSRWRFPHPQDPIDPKNTVGKTFIVTGASSGIAKEFAREVMLAGGHVVLAVRDTDAGLRSIDEIKETAVERGIDPASLEAEVMHLDLGSLDSIRSFAGEWNARQAPVHVLANIAGETYWGGRVPDTPDGFETHIQVNFLAPALLQLELLPSLLRGAPSRIVNVASCVHELATLDLPGIANGRGPNWSLWGNALGAYNHSKLAFVMFSSTLQRKLPADCGVDVLAIHPGLIGSRAIRGVWKWFEWLVRDVFSKFMILEPTEGARGVLFVATSDEALAHAREIRRRNSTDGPYFGSLGQAMHVARQGQDEALGEDLWTLSLQILDVPLDHVEQQVAQAEKRSANGVLTDTSSRR